MNDRRAFIFSLAGAMTAAPFSRAYAARVFTDGTVAKPVMLRGDPPKMDFGGGLRIPMSKAAFKTLWEGQDRWITYGVGTSSYNVLALGNATISARSTMKLFLLTLAFAPDRLEKVYDCGWRSKFPDLKDLIQGDIDLPGRPFMPVTDTYSGDALSGEGIVDANGGFAKVHAFTGYMLMKKDVSLAYVRAKAQLL